VKAAIFACWFAAAAAVGAAGYAAGYDHGVRDEGVRSMRDMDQLVLALDELGKWQDSWRDIAEVLRAVTERVVDPTCGGKYPSLRQDTPKTKPAPKSAKRVRGTVARRK